MRELTILKDDFMTDWYVLVDKETKERLPAAVSVEGSLKEWQDIAEGIMNKKDVHFRRCAVDNNKDEFYFYSPRNSYDTEDFYDANEEQAVSLVKEIQNASIP